MAKRDNQDVMQSLRAAGVRKKLARALSDSADSGQKSGTINRSVKSLKSAAKELEARSDEAHRRDAAKKAAATRKRKAAKRSAAARKGAKTGAKHA